MEKVVSWLYQKIASNELIRAPHKLRKHHANLVHNTTSQVLSQRQDKTRVPCVYVCGYMDKLDIGPQIQSWKLRK